jgi:hypothetical protein
MNTAYKHVDHVIEYSKLDGFFYKRSYHESFDILSNDADGYFSISIDIRYHVTRSGVFKYDGFSYNWLEGPFCPYDKHYCHDADGHHYSNMEMCRYCNRIQK